MKKKTVLFILLVILVSLIGSTMAEEYTFHSSTIDAPVSDSMQISSASDCYADSTLCAKITISMSLDTLNTIDGISGDTFRSCWNNSSWIGITNDKRKLMAVEYYSTETSTMIIKMIFNPSTGKIEYTPIESTLIMSNEEIEKQCESLFSDDNSIAEYKKNDFHAVLSVLSKLGVTTYESYEDVYKKIVSDLCQHTVSYWKENGGEFTALFGSPYIKHIFVFKDETKGLFYIKTVCGFDKNEESKSTNMYYFKVTHFGFIQLTDPEQPVNDNDWILLNKYTEIECYETALANFTNQRWKDPSSVTIYGYSTLYDYNTFTFVIDYSAKNSLGGSTRDYHYVTVNFNTNTVKTSY